MNLIPTDEGKNSIDNSFFLFSLMIISTVATTLIHEKIQLHFFHSKHDFDNLRIQFDFSILSGV